jgi:hypothetical protein
MAAKVNGDCRVGVDDARVHHVADAGGPGGINGVAVLGNPYGHRRIARNEQQDFRPAKSRPHAFVVAVVGPAYGDARCDESAAFPGSRAVAISAGASGRRSNWVRVARPR